MKPLEIEMNGKIVRVFAERIGTTLWLHYNGQTFTYEEKAKSRRAQQATAGTGTLVAPMPGKIIDVSVKKDQSVKKGELLVTLEAMKMEYNLKSDTDGLVAELNCKQGQQVQQGQVLAVVSNSEG